MSEKLQDDSASAESRKAQRFDAAEGATAAIVTPDEKGLYASIGEIVDVSMGGLSIQYDAKSGSYHGFVDLEIEIFGYSNQRMRMYVGRLPCKVVYDKVIATDEERAMEKHHIGLKFDEIPYFKLHKLSNFVEIFTKAKKQKEAHQAAEQDQ
jgi:hypothetical protein